MSDQNFTIGDVVQLKSLTGPLMVVAAVGTDKLECAFFDEEKRDFVTKNVLSVILTKVDANQGKP